MKNNPLLTGAEWVYDFVAGQSASAACQWRGAVVPTQRIGKDDFISELLQDSHSQTKDEVAGGAGFPEPYALEMSDGTLVSFLLVRGARTNLREFDVGTKAAKIAQKLAAYMNTGRGDTHSFGIYFLHDPFTAKQVFDQKIAPMLATARRFGGNADRFMEDLRSRLVHRAAEEMTLFTIRTHMRALRKEEYAVAEKQYRNMIGAIMKSGAGVKNMARALHSPYGQALLSRSLPILQRHEGLVTTLLSDFNSRDIGLSMTLLGIRETFERVQRFADREIPFRPGWTARLFGQEGTTLTPTGDSPATLSLGMQVLTRKIVGEIDSVETAKIGNTWYGTTVMELGPVSPRRNPSQTLFSTLMQKIKEAAIPMCMSFEILPKGLEYNKLNQFFNSFLGAIGTNNRQIRTAYQELRQYEEEHGKTDPTIGLRVGLSTWGNSKERAEKALLELNLAVQGWGGAQPNSETGYPDLARLASIPEFKPDNHAPILPAPLTDAVYMSPIMRAASPWDYGQLLFKTNDGVIYPVGIGTSKHASYVCGIFAPSGYGKSFLTNRIHSSLALSPGAQQVPYITNIDVAPSGEGSLRLLRTILPESMHSQMVYYKVLNHEDYCVNPHDVQLGCYQPTGPEWDFLTSVYEEVFEGIGEEMNKLIDAMLTEAYRYFHPDSTTARIWQSGDDPVVAAALEKVGFHIAPDKEVTVYQVVDALFAAGDIENARIAQRYAVPRMEDMGRILKSERMIGLYGTAKAATGEALLDKAVRDVITATSAFPVIASVTRKDLDNSRIKVIDLQNVLSGSSASSLKFAGMMYMYARHLGARNYFLDVDEIKTICRPAYLEYQVKRVREIQQTPKVLTYDEWHNVNRVKGMMSLNIKETRETRKFRVYVNFISQYVTDAPEEVLNGMTTIMVVGQASTSQNTKTKAILGLSDTDFEILEGELNRIGRIWAWFKLRDGQVTALLNNEVGPLETWCYTTDDKDTPLRNALTDLIGETAAVLLLAEEFPSGSAATYLDRRSRSMSAEQSSQSGVTVTSIVAQELAAKFNERARSDRSESEPAIA